MPAPAATTSETLEYFVDLSSDKFPLPLIAGKIALEAYLAGLESSDPQVHPLGEVLLDPDIELPSLPSHRSITNLDLSPEDLKANGKKILESTGKVNTEILARARRLGLMLSEKAIRRIFGSYPSFYAEIGVDGAKEKLEKLNENAPLEEIDMESWDAADYITWGVQFMQANNGLMIADDFIDHLAAEGKGPACTEIGKVFTNGDYGSQVRSMHTSTETESRDAKLRKLAQIKAILAGKGNRDIPAEIFEGVSEEDELIKRYAKYLVLNAFLGDDNTKAKISLATGSTAKAKERDFASVLCNNVSREIFVRPGEVEIKARLLDVLDDIWPPDTSYMETLKLPEEFLTSRKASLAKPTD